MLDKEAEHLYHKISTHVVNAKNNVVRSINTEMVKAYWLIGRDIVLHEQQGESRAEYGKFIIDRLSEQLTKQFKRGFSVETLVAARRFYLIYQDDNVYGKQYTLCTGTKAPDFNINLSWSHYRNLMRISREDARTFYEQEAIKNCWSVREMQRQIHSMVLPNVKTSFHLK